MCVCAAVQAVCHQQVQEAQGLGFQESEAAGVRFVGRTPVATEL